MNKQRKKSIEKIIEQIMKLNENIEEVLWEEEDAYDNIPENLQESERARISEESIDLLTEAKDYLVDANDSLSSILDL